MVVKMVNICCTMQAIQGGYINCLWYLIHAQIAQFQNIVFFFTIPEKGGGQG